MADVPAVHTGWNPTPEQLQLYSALVDVFSTMKRPAPHPIKLQAAFKSLSEKWLDNIDCARVAFASGGETWTMFKEVVKQHLEVQDVFFDALASKLRAPSPIEPASKRVAAAGNCIGMALDASILCDARAKQAGVQHLPATPMFMTEASQAQAEPLCMDFTGHTISAPELQGGPHLHTITSPGSAPMDPVMPLPMASPVPPPANVGPHVPAAPPMVTLPAMTAPPAVPSVPVLGSAPMYTRKQYMYTNSNPSAPSAPLVVPSPMSSPQTILVGNMMVPEEGSSKATSGRVRRCTFEGCTKSARGGTKLCIGHGGGKRCGQEGCHKSAVEATGLCVKHGGGKRCGKDGCQKSAVGGTHLCIGHGGGKRCEFNGCHKSAQGGTRLCIGHGGGKRCTVEGCGKAGQGSKQLCVGHGRLTPLQPSLALSVHISDTPFLHLSHLHPVCCIYPASTLPHL